MKKNLNPLYVLQERSFLGLKFGSKNPTELIKAWNTGLDAGIKQSANNDVRSPQEIKNAQEFALKGKLDASDPETKARITKHGMVGGIVGGGLGGLAGTAITRKMFKVKERKAIKSIILTSSSPEDCINKLKELGTERALKYCDVVDSVSKEKPNDWKNDVLTSINIKNIVPQVVGGVAGTYIGNRIGHGMGTVSGMGTQVISQWKKANNK